MAVGGPFPTVVDRLGRPSWVSGHRTVRPNTGLDTVRLPFHVPCPLHRHRPCSVDWSTDHRSRRSLAMTRSIHLVLAFGLLVLLLVATPGMAGAHAQLESSEPGQSAVLLVPPTRVALHFGEPVEIDFGSLRVIGPGGGRVDGGAAHHPDGDVHAVAVSLPANLPDGTYVVAWRVVSADSHPVHGAFVFSIGTASGAARADALAVSIANQKGDTSVGVIYWLLRFVAFVALLTLVGLAAMVAFLWSGGGRTRRVARVLW